MSSGELKIVPLSEDHMQAAWSLNQLYAHVLTSLSIDEFAFLITQCTISFAAVNEENCVGFILVMDETSSYDSDNFIWFKERYSRFLYNDRIAIDPEWQGYSIGARLYQSIAKEALKRNYDKLCCEVSLSPERNEQSLAFHKKLGFEPCGNRVYANGDGEVLMFEHNKLEHLMG